MFDYFSVSVANDIHILNGLFDNNETNDPLIITLQQNYRQASPNGWHRSTFEDIFVQYGNQCLRLML